MMLKPFDSVLSQLVEGYHEKLAEAVELVLLTRINRQRAYIIGNGGSAAIASHMAADWLKNYQISAFALDSAPTLTAVANDMGYENVYSMQLSRHIHAGDLLVAISSRGESGNIYKAAYLARERGATVVTLSGFDPDNRLKGMGKINFHVDASDYGTVEVAHHAIMHAITDALGG
jgi:D-sedoheptulose 7-phosphate isomerase